jgi:hypothetical protein
MSDDVFIELSNKELKCLIRSIGLLIKCFCDEVRSRQLLLNVGDIREKLIKKIKERTSYE